MGPDGVFDSLLEVRLERDRLSLNNRRRYSRSQTTS